MLCFEHAHGGRAALPGHRAVVAAIDLFLGCPSGEQVRHRVHQLERLRYRDARLVEEHEASATGSVQWREWQDVLLAGVGQRSEPDATVLATQELTDRRLLALAGVGIAGGSTKRSNSR